MKRIHKYSKKEKDTQRRNRRKDIEKDLNEAKCKADNL
jgi:hypothetical protein